VQGYTSASYGDSFAGEDFEAVHGFLPDPEPMIEMLTRNAGNGPVLELGVGTGRVARPLAARGIPVDGIDISDAMLDGLRRSAGELPIRPIKCDLAHFRVTRRYSLVFCVWNTFFSLRTREQQAHCIQAVSQALLPDGRFVIETFVPDPDHFTNEQELRVRGITANSVSLQVSLHDASRQTIASQHIVISRDGIRLHPHEIRYAWPSEIDAMARSAGLRLRERWAGWHYQPFNETARDHVSIYDAAEDTAIRAAVSAS
jgi:SAM-dependent methyltransferase